MKKEQLPLMQEIENFLRDTMRAALKIKDDIHLRVDVLKAAISWDAVVSKHGAGSDTQEGALLDVYKQFITPTGQREGDTRPTTTEATTDQSAV